MAQVTVYCVLPFWDDGRRLARGEMLQFTAARKAEKAGLRAASRNAGAIVFSVRGDPEMDLWEEPRLVEAYGDVPAIQMGDANIRAMAKAIPGHPASGEPPTDLAAA